MDFGGLGKVRVKWVLDPQFQHVLDVLIPHTDMQFANPSGVSSVQLNSDTIYLVKASDPTG